MSRTHCLHLICHVVDDWLKSQTHTNHGSIMRHLARQLLAAMALLGMASQSSALTIDFDDVEAASQDLTHRYESLGVTLNSINNGFPQIGPYPAGDVLPATVAGVVPWSFDAAPSQPYAAVAAPSPGSSQAGNDGILISFAFDVDFVSLIGHDMGSFMGEDNEGVTLTAYDAAGARMGQTHTTAKLPGEFDQVFASISGSGIRHVAFNYTGTRFGFYAIDDLSFTPAVPEPSSWLLGLIGLAIGVAAKRRRPPCLQSA